MHIKMNTYWNEYIFKWIHIEVNTYWNEYIFNLILIQMKISRVRILELYTCKVCEMFVNKHSETTEYIKI